MPVETLEIVPVESFHGHWEVICSNKNGFNFPLVMDSKTRDKITGKEVTLPKVVKFRTFNQAKSWLMPD